MRLRATVLEPIYRGGLVWTSPLSIRRFVGRQCRLLLGRLPHLVCLVPLHRLGSGMDDSRGVGVVALQPGRQRRAIIARAAIPGELSLGSAESRHEVGHLGHYVMYTLLWQCLFKQMFY